MVSANRCRRRGLKLTNRRDDPPRVVVSLINRWSHFGGGGSAGGRELAPPQATPSAVKRRVAPALSSGALSRWPFEGVARWEQTRSTLRSCARIPPRKAQ